MRDIQINVPLKLKWHMKMININHSICHLLLFFSLSYHITYPAKHSKKQPVKKQCNGIQKRKVTSNNQSYFYHHLYHNSTRDINNL